MDRILERQFPRNTIHYIKGGDEQTAQRSVNLLEKLSEEEKRNIKYVWGGAFFGIHKYLPQTSTYFTLLRNPVERVISEYYHVLENRNHPMYREVTSGNINLDEYVRSGMWLAWNGQVRYIRGPEEGSWFEYGPVQLSKEDLTIACENLRKHFAIGITERFDESLILLKRAFGWKTKDILYVRHKVAKNRPRSEKISQDIINLIEIHNELDLQLYEFANNLLDEQISLSASIEGEVQTFRLLNKVYGTIRNTGGSVRHLGVSMLRTIRR